MIPEKPDLNFAFKSGFLPHGRSPVSPLIHSIPVPGRECILQHTGMIHIQSFRFGRQAQAGSFQLSNEPVNQHRMTPWQGYLKPDLWLYAVCAQIHVQSDPVGKLPGRQRFAQRFAVILPACGGQKGADCCPGIK